MIKIYVFLTFQISQVFDRFRNNEKAETDTAVVDRVNSTELCKWSETVTYTKNLILKF
jgi:hypothetical protein